MELATAKFSMRMEQSQHEAQKREAGQRARWLLTALEAVIDNGVWLTPGDPATRGDRRLRNRHCAYQYAPHGIDPQVARQLLDRYNDVHSAGR